MSACPPKLPVSSPSVPRFLFYNGLHTWWIRIPDLDIKPAAEKGWGTAPQEKSLKEKQGDGNLSVLAIKYLAILAIQFLAIPRTTLVTSGQL